MSENNSIWYFEDVDLYRIFCPHYVKRHEKDHGHSFLSFGKEQFIYFESDPSEKVYLVSQGKVKIGTYLEDGREITKAVLRKGEIFGEMALMGEDRRKDFAQAIDDAIICPLNLQEMEGLMLEHKNLSLKVRQLISVRLRKAERMIASLLFKSSRQRVIEYVVELAEDRGTKVGFEIEVKEFFSHKIIGSLTATSRQTVTTVLNDLRNKDLISFNRKRLLVRDLGGLKKELERE